MQLARIDHGILTEENQAMGDRRFLAEEFTELSREGNELRILPQFVSNPFQLLDSPRLLEICDVIRGWPVLGMRLAPRVQQAPPPIKRKHSSHLNAPQLHTLRGARPQNVHATANWVGRLVACGWVCGVACG